MRHLKVGSIGEDVLRVKQRLLELGCYDPQITQIKLSSFGRDTQRAVKAFQDQHGLIPDGIVGPLTFAALFPSGQPNTPPVDRVIIPINIGDEAAAAIIQALESVGDTRRAIVLDALQYAYDPAVPRDYPLSLYIRGGNLYNADLAPNVISLERISSGAARQPEYYNGGRREMMERAVLANPAITGADCSGGVVGLLRHAGVVRPDFDLAADGFASSRSYVHIDAAELQPADLLHKSGHIGIYAGGGYGVEWMGGAYGCQLTKINARRGWNFVKGRPDRFSSWTTLLRPKSY